MHEVAYPAPLSAGNETFLESLRDGIARSCIVAPAATRSGGVPLAPFEMAEPVADFLFGSDVRAGSEAGKVEMRTLALHTFGTIV